MTVYAKIIDGAVAEYPHDIEQVRADNPGTSFPRDLAQADLTDFGVVPVAATTPPNATANETAEEATPEFIDAQWRQAWVKRNRTANELTAAKAAKWNAVKTKRTQALAAGCTVPGIGAFQTGEQDMANVHEAVTGALLAGATGQPYTITFTLADNSRPTLTATQMMTAGKVIGERKSAIHAYSQALRGQIVAAQDFAALAAIDINTGWPT